MNATLAQTKNLIPFLIAGLALLPLLKRGKPGPLRPGLPAPQDLDGDGLYEDLNGDGVLDQADVDELLSAITFENPDVLNNPRWYDFDGNGSVGVGDVIVLLQILGSQGQPIARLNRRHGLRSRK